VNPNNGKKERVFVDLRAVYPTPEQPGTELSFEEIWAANRGWLDTSWEDEPEEEEEEPSVQEGNLSSEVDLLCEGVTQQLVVHQEETPQKIAIHRDVSEKMVIHQDVPAKMGIFRDASPKMAIHRDASPKLAVHRDTSEKLVVRQDVLQLDENGAPIYPKENKIMLDENGAPIYPGASKPRKKKVVEENQTQISESPCSLWL
jgi:checkpoint serine/threonine-protein kinase